MKISGKIIIKGARVFWATIFVYNVNCMFYNIAQLAPKRHRKTEMLNFVFVSLCLIINPSTIFPSLKSIKKLIEFHICEKVQTKLSQEKI